MPAPVVFDRIPKEDIPRAMLLDLAAEFGIRDDVAAVPREKEAAGQFGLRNLPLGQMLKHTRMVRGFSRLAMAERIGIAPAILCLMESGRSKNLRLDTAEAMGWGCRIPFVVLICAALRELGCLPAPGAKPILRNRVRNRDV